MNKLLYGLLGLVVIGCGVMAYKLFHHEDVVMVKILSATANYKTVKVSHQSCHDVVSNYKVKNPNRNFFNGIFDSKNHPKYINKQSVSQKCDIVASESEVLQNYTMQYQVKHAIESAIVQNQPTIGMEIPLVDLQQYITSLNESSVRACLLSLK